MWKYNYIVYINSVILLFNMNHREIHCSDVEVLAMLIKTIYHLSFVLISCEKSFTYFIDSMYCVQYILTFIILSVCFYWPSYTIIINTFKSFFFFLKAEVELFHAKQIMVHEMQKIFYKLIRDASLTKKEQQKKLINWNWMNFLYLACRIT